MVDEFTEAKIKQVEDTLWNTPELRKLEKMLKNKYPSHHYKHVAVWSSFWALVETIGEN